MRDHEMKGVPAWLPPIVALLLVTACKEPNKYVPPDPARSDAASSDALGSGSGGRPSGQSTGTGGSSASPSGSTDAEPADDGPPTDAPAPPPVPDATVEQCAAATCDRTKADGCCVAGCTPLTDVDCAGCGNGRLEPGEACDPPSSCPTACAEIPCTRQTLTGTAEACSARCEEQKITACMTGDKCCPRAANPSCNATNDTECAAICGNGAVEAGESCDPVAACQGVADACKDDRDVIRKLAGVVGSCTVTCTDQKRPCMAGDGQCPSTCNPSNDADCVGCGNGKIEAGETCDPASQCMSRRSACTSNRDVVRTSSGDVSNCTYRCDEAPRACGPSDGQCPSGCTGGQDTDCKKPLGQTCTGNPDCVSGQCVGGVCCNTACDDGCRSCRINGKVGTCSPPSTTETCDDGRDNNCNGSVDENCCGGRNQRCCTDQQQKNQGCEAGNACDAGRICRACGGNGQPCCTDEANPLACNGNALTCSFETVNLTCRPCGRIGETCCERPTTSGNYFCNEGRCNGAFPFACIE
jgi:hypothetical protein